MNLALRGIDSSNVRWNDDGSFLNDAHPDLRADYVIANPPFNDSDWSGEMLRTDGRWQYGEAPLPAGNANYAWIQHFIWGRYGTPSRVTDEEMGEAFWSWQYSFSDVEALLSHDVSLLWQAFPGYGVYHNGRVYSPEWIMQNIEQAVTVERIPLAEVERIVEMASDFSYFLGDVVVSAETFLQTEAVR